MEYLFQVEQTAQWLKEFGIWAIIASLLLNVIIAILGIVPSLFLSGANAVVFGIVPGFLLSLTGEVLGAGVSFGLYRYGFRKMNIKKSESWKWLNNLNGASRRRKVLVLLLARITPFIPSGVVSFAAAVSNMKFVDFMIVTFLGKAPSITLETLAGYDLVFNNYSRLTISIFFACLIWFLLRRMNKQMDINEREDNHGTETEKFH
ncbi:TVP38/TMEM64 family protein [Paenibacillus sp. GYB004]|uniref:TVP38/TMEM64 family protein n=1 Tax=Paenibacillus sp. GYB004 TaxID=2994393 RepID=UPI002F96D546